LIHIRVGERGTNREDASNGVAALLSHRSDTLDKALLVLPLFICEYLKALTVVKSWICAARPSTCELKLMTRPTSKSDVWNDFVRAFNPSTTLYMLCAPTRAVSERSASETSFMAVAEEEKCERARSCGNRAQSMVLL
jgi:hypothetical protein